MTQAEDHHISFCLGERTIDFRLGFHPSWVGKSVYEPEVVHCMGRFVQPGDWVVDAGANLGFFSLLLSQLVGPDGVVTAFEADPNCVNALRRNIALNDVENISVLHHALWSHECEMDFWLMEESGYSSVVRYDISEKKPHKIDAMPLDDLIRECYRRPRLIKIDCEGAEEEILHGMEKALREGIDAVIVELNFQLMDQIGMSEQSIREYMEKFGYDFFLLHRDGRHPVYVPPGDRIKVVSGFPNLLNVLFSTREKVDRLWI